MLASQDVSCSPSRMDLPVHSPPSSPQVDSSRNSRLLVVGLPFLVGLLAASGFQTDPPQTISAMTVLFPFLVAIGMNVVLILFLDRASKKVARRRYQIEVDRSVGWNVNWRMWLMAMALTIPAAVLITSGAVLVELTWQLSDHDALVFSVAANGVDALIRILLVVMACGWAFGRVLKLFATKTQLA